MNTNQNKPDARIEVFSRGPAIRSQNKTFRIALYEGSDLFGEVESTDRKKVSKKADLIVGCVNERPDLIAERDALKARVERLVAALVDSRRLLGEIDAGRLPNFFDINTREEWHNNARLFRIAME